MFRQRDDYRQLFEELSRKNVNQVRMYECGDNATRLSPPSSPLLAGKSLLAGAPRWVMK